MTRLFYDPARFVPGAADQGRLVELFHGKLVEQDFHHAVFGRQDAGLVLLHVVGGDRTTSGGFPMSFTIILIPSEMD